jgi:cyclopropane fatty-acyl-phospholipid synthase-like methyltransferase
MISPGTFFHTLRYLRGNARRLEHLAGLGLPLHARSVLEIGAGIGDLTPFFLDRDCTVTSVEPREDNVAYFRARYEEDPLWPPDRLRIVQSDVDHLEENGVGVHDIVFCYGALNEMEKPSDALRAFAERCREMLILEATVNSGIGLNEDVVTYVPRNATDVRASITGSGCFPTRRWVFNRLREHFEHVYLTLTQPSYDRFLLCWRGPLPERPQHRVIFVASRLPLASALLVEDIPDIQYRSL